ncbi:transcription factor TFIIA-L, partial [Fusarium tjaetaba]
MSNPAVGNVYQAIIDEVVNSSRVDFEESGVEESVLEELRQEYGVTKDSRFCQVAALSFEMTSRAEDRLLVEAERIAGSIAKGGAEGDGGLRG